jgi:hypothetical protein
VLIYPPSIFNRNLEYIGSPESENSVIKYTIIGTDISWSEIGFCNMLWGYLYRGEVLLDLVYRLSAEVELDKLLAVLYNTVLVVSSREGKRDNLSRDGKESISGSCYRG